MEYCNSEDFKNCLLYEELFEYELIFWHGSSGWRSTALLLRIIGDPLPITFPLLVVRLESFSLPFKVWVSIMASKRLRFPSEWFDWKFISETLLIDIMYCWRLYWAFLKVRLILLIKKNGYRTIFSSMNFIKNISKILILKTHLRLSRSKMINGMMYIVTRYIQLIYTAMYNGLVLKSVVVSVGLDSILILSCVRLLSILVTSSVALFPFCKFYRCFQ